MISYRPDPGISGGNTEGTQETSYCGENMYGQWTGQRARRQIFLTMRARSGQCVSVTEVSQILSGESANVL